MELEETAAEAVGGSPGGSGPGPGPGPGSPLSWASELAAAAAGAGRGEPHQVEARSGSSTPLVAPELVTLEDIAVPFSAEEWSLLEGWQKQLHKDVMLESYALLVSLGNSVPSAEVSSLIHQLEGAMPGQNFGQAGREDGTPGGDHESPEDMEGPWDMTEMRDDRDGEVTPTASKGNGDACRSSLHLCALMKLVKEIPEFLYGHVKAPLDPVADPNGRETEEVTEVPQGDAKTAGQTGSVHLLGFPGDLADVSLSLSSSPETPTSSTEEEWVESQAPGGAKPMEVAREEHVAPGWKEHKKEAHGSRARQGSPPANREAEPCTRSPAVGAQAILGRPLAHGGPAKIREHPGGARSPSAPHQDQDADSPSGSITKATERTPAGGQPVPPGASPGPGHPSRPGSPKEREDDVPRPLGPSWSASLYGSPAREERLVPELWGGKEDLKEKAAEEKPLQGLLKGLKELIVHQPRHPSQASCKSSTGACPETQAPRRRKVGSGSLSIRVKIEASEEELCNHHPGSPGKEGPGPPVAQAANTSAFQTEGGGITIAPPMKDGHLSAAVKIERMSHSPQLQHPDGPRNTLGCPGATGEQSLVDEAAVFGVKIKMEPEAKEEELPLRGLKGSPEGGEEEEEEEEEGPLPPSLPSRGSPCSSLESRVEPGLWVPYSEEWSPATSPLHGLLNCLKEIPTPKQPCASKTVAEKRGGGGGGGGGGERRKGSRRGRQGPARDNLPSRGTEERPVQQLLPLPAGQASSNQGRDAELQKSGPRVTQGGRGTPLESLARCLKGLPLNAPSQPCSPAISSSLGSSPERLLRWTPERGRRARKGEGLGRESSTPLQGLEKCLQELPLGSPNQTPSPMVSSSFSTSPDGCHRWTPEAGRWARKEQGGGCSGAPLQGLERCLKELPLSSPGQLPSSQALSSSFGSSPDGRRLRWTPEAGRRARKEGGTISTRIPPLQGLENCLKEIALSRNPLPHLASSSCTQRSRGREGAPQGLQARGGPAGSPLRHLPGGPSGSSRADARAESSPLRRLMSCLEEIPIRRPSYLNTPSASSSSSSSCSETEREQESPRSGACSNCSQDTRQGSETEEVAGQSQVETWRRRRRRKRRQPSEQGGGFPAQELDLVEVEPCIPPASPVRRAESCLKERAVSQSLPSEAPPPSANAQRNRMPRGSEAGRAAKDARSPPRSQEDTPGGAAAAATTTACTQSCSDTSAQAPLGRTLERDAEWSRPEGRVQCSHAEAKQKAATSNRYPQSVTHSPVETPASPLKASSTRSDSALKEWDAHRGMSSMEGGLNESSPLQGLLRCLKEITARGPSPGSLSASRSPAERRCQQAKEEEEATRASREGPGGTLKERPASRASLADAPLNSPWGGAVKRSPTPEADWRHGDSAPTSPADGVLGSSPEGNRCPALPNGRPPTPKSCARRLSESHSQRNGVKRSFSTARNDDGPALGTRPCSTESQGEEDPGTPSKKKYPILDLPSPRRSCGSGKSLESKAELGDLGPILSRKLDRLSADMSAICRDVAQLQSHLDRLEQDARGWGLELATLRMENRSLSEYVRRMEGRCRSLESRSRRNNLRMVGLPEGAEGSDPLSFLQRTLPEMLALPAESRPLEIESARRVHGGVAWDTNGRPRPLVFRLLRFADKAAILQAAHARPLSYAGAQVTILSDFCSSLSQRRRVPLGAFRRTRWLADLCFGPRHASFCHPWAQGRREPALATSGPLAGEREGRAPKGPEDGNWDTDPSAGSGRHGGCLSPGSCEQHNP